MKIIIRWTDKPGKHRISPTHSHTCLRRLSQGSIIGISKVDRTFPCWQLSGKQEGEVILKEIYPGKKTVQNGLFCKRENFSHFFHQIPHHLALGPKYTFLLSLTFPQRVMGERVVPLPQKELSINKGNAYDGSLIRFC